MSEYNPSERRAPRPTNGARPQNVRPRTGEPVRRPVDYDGRPVRRPQNGQPVRRPAPPQKKRKPARKRHTGLILFLILVLLLVGGAGYMYFEYPEKANALIDQCMQYIKPQPTQRVTAVNTYNNTGSAFADLLSSVETDVDTLTGGNSVTVSDLSITQGLDETWMNILLLGADARSNTEPARTDTMMILSINRVNGNVKLASIMRDTAVSFEGHKNVRLNAAYFFGGERLAIKTINEYFGMNIDKYVYVDFNGFASIAEVLGGITMDLSINEMDQINKNVVEQYKILIQQGKMEYADAEREFFATELLQAGDQIHLNGMQTLGYARIRKIDNDYARAERQRKVLNTLMANLQKASSSQLITLFGKCASYFRTNLSMNECIELASLVLNREDFRLADELRLPVAGSYKEEKRNNEAMLYDMDVETNRRELHNFIYAVR